MLAPNNKTMSGVDQGLHLAYRRRQAEQKVKEMILD
jgi:hypothetical protein